MDRREIKNLARDISFRLIDLNLLLISPAVSKDKKESFQKEYDRINAWWEKLLTIVGPEPTPKGFIPFVKRYATLPTIPVGTHCLKRGLLGVVSESKTEQEYNNFVSFGVIEFDGIIYVKCGEYRFFDETHCIYIKLNILKKLYKQQNQ